MKARLVVLLLLSMSFSAIAVLPDTASATTLYVGGAGPGNYTDIQDAIQAASPGDTVYVYSGTYEEHVSISKSLSLVGEGKETTTISGPRKESVINISANWVNVSGFTTIKGHSNHFGPIIWLTNARDCRITDNNASYEYHGYAGILLSHSDGNVITGNNFHDRGIRLENSNRNIVSDNNVLGSEYSIVLLDSDDNLVSSNDISFAGKAIELLDSDRNTVIGNNASMTRWTGLWLRRSSHNMIADNVFDMESGTGLVIQQSINSTVLRNELIGGGISVSAWEPQHWNSHTIDTTNLISGKPVHYLVDVVGGKVPLGAGQVILINCSDVIVENQDISNTDSGIAVVYSSNITIANSSISWNRDGISFFQSNNSSIINNTIFSNSGGIRIAESHNNTIANNTSAHNSHGMDLRESNRNTVTGNLLSHNSLGIGISESNDNMVFHNVFLENRNQAGDVSYPWLWENQWDGGYPDGGNFWSDLFPMDVMSGPGQNETGSDGIADRAYEIGSYSEDRYPLVNSTISLENVLPTCTIVVPEPGATVSGKITVQGTAHDSDGVVMVVKIRIEGDGWVDWFPVDGTTALTTEMGTTHIPNGDLTISVQACDAYGCIDEVNVTVVIDNHYPPPPTPPTTEKSVLEEILFWVAVAILAVAVVAALVLRRRRREGSEE